MFVPPATTHPRDCRTSVAAYAEQLGAEALSASRKDRHVSAAVRGGKKGQACAGRRQDRDVSPLSTSENQPKHQLVSCLSLVESLVENLVEHLAWPLSLVVLALLSSTHRSRRACPPCLLSAATVSSRGRPAASACPTCLSHSAPRRTHACPFHPPVDAHPPVPSRPRARPRAFHHADRPPQRHRHPPDPCHEDRHDGRPSRRRRARR